jgi:acetyl-CoA acetyltransferase
VSRPRFEARGRVAIAGYAHSPIVRHATVPLGALTVETCLRAIADAGVTKDQIDGFTTGALFPSSGGRAPVDGVHVVTSAWLVEQLRVKPRWLCGFQGIGQLPGAVILATDAIASGAADYVVVHRAMFNPTGGYHENPMTRAEGAAQWVAPQGFWGPPTQMALPYMEYIQRYGATREDMATVVVEARSNGAAVPWSHWYAEPITAQDYLGARMIAEPLSVLDCDIPVTGVGAFVLTSAERARDMPHRPVYVAGYAQGHWRPATGVNVWPLDDLIEGGREVARMLWDNTGLSREDVDLPLVYDGFSPFVYFWLEALGYCERGEAHRFVRDGRIRTGDGLPVLSGGGALGNGRMHGVPQMLECYLQLSRRAGERQLPTAEVGFACQAAPSIGGVVAYTSEPMR